MKKIELLFLTHVLKNIIIYNKNIIKKQFMKIKFFYNIFIIMKLYNKMLKTIFYGIKIIFQIVFIFHDFLAQ